MATGDAIAATTPVSGTTTPTSNSNTSSSSNTSIAGNFQTFLTLLTTQLKNQNPLDPLDTNQFTQQLVQFAGVEQQLKTNDQLASLLSVEQTTQATQALAFVGKTAVVNGSTTSMVKSAAAWNLNIPSNCNLTLTITNSVGQTVYTGKASASAGNNQPFQWDGRGNDGTQWPDGQYKLTTTATDTSGKPVAITTQIAGVVSSVDLSQQPPLLSIGGQTYTVNQIQQIVN
ncbi:putative flagellar basal-body rod modification protein FlgD [Bradyrhizobium sp. STM 3843]|uniref:flagellar hook assembly protein FlgD n=1 Tax=Bradyrhizobium sp. STM 3843 TaxID=551947 RepID=UPI00024052EC|nr:flagellar hook capping FlgD N-terminal domain-containing protein [Bradyrhizobium sp. STM 3843]CCE08136.1 putative flagellar basal-body rod modification protein FlgD [Bradyrhizobium sp. STM 3843]